MRSAKSSGEPEHGYIGRFAPSPSGALHFGSLLAALASYLDARAHSGQWLVRMEDLDPAREPPGAADQILRTLEAFGLFWDGQVIYQSQRQAAYFEALEQLQHQSLTFPCTCSRKRIKAMGGVYDGKCRKRQSPPRHDFATRLKVSDELICIPDQIQGDFVQNLLHHCGDFILQRRDGLIAYQLAVVVDDAWQQVTDIVRGYDLLESTPRQVFLQRLLGYPRPNMPIFPSPPTTSGKSSASSILRGRYWPASLDRPLIKLWNFSVNSLQLSSPARLHQFRLTGLSSIGIYITCPSWLISRFHPC